MWDMNDMTAYYNGIAQGYDELYKEEQEQKLTHITKHFTSEFTIKETDTLLDVGCGSGVSTLYFKTKTQTGIDPSKELIRLAKQKSSTAKFSVAPAEAIPFNDNQFDVVLSLTAIQNFDDIDKGICEIARVGKDRFIVTFLKNSPKKQEIRTCINRHLTIIKEIEETKDWIIFAQKP